MSSPSPYQAQLDLAKVIVVRRSSRFIGLTSTSFLFCRLPQSAALKAGEIIASYSSVGRSSNSARVDVKSGVDLVTEADTRVEKVVISMIRDAYPNDVIVGEEDQAVTPLGRPGEEFPSDRNIWCIDPIDGVSCSLDFIKAEFTSIGAHRLLRLRTSSTATRSARSRSGT